MPDLKDPKKQESVYLNADSLRILKLFLKESEAPSCAQTISENRVHSPQWVNSGKSSIQCFALDYQILLNYIKNYLQERLL